MIRLLRWLAGAVVLGLVGTAGLAACMRSLDSDPARWHRPLAEVAAPGRKNAALAAAPGYLLPGPDIILMPRPDPVAILAALDRIALAEPRTRRLAGSPEEGRITWMQRSAVFGFPDYITAEAGPEGWALWSRARFGRRDLGVNRARLERWLTALDGNTVD